MTESRNSKFETRYWKFETGCPELEGDEEHNGNFRFSNFDFRISIFEFRL